MNVLKKCGSWAILFLEVTSVKLTETTWIKEKFQKPEYYTDSISSCANWIQIPTEPFQLREQFKLRSAPAYVF